MALSAATVWEIRTTGSDTLCSGGFVAGASGTDYSQQDSAQYNATDLVAPTTTTITSASHTFVAADVGNIVRVTAGTGWTVGFYQIVSVAAGTATVDRAIATAASTGGTYCVGGALASLGGYGLSGPVSLNTIWVKSGAYTITSASTNVAGGCLSLSGLAAGGVNIVGYSTTRGDNPTDSGRPVFTAGSISTFTIINSPFGSKIAYMEFDGNLRTSSKGIQNGSISAQNNFLKCSQFTNRAIDGNAFACEVTGCTTTAGALYSTNGVVAYCYVHDNSVTGVWATTCVNTISESNTGSGSHGFDDGFTINNSSCVNCVAYNNGGSGFRAGSGAASTAFYINCIAYLNGAHGFICSTPSVLAWMRKCGTGSNTSGATSGFTAAFATGGITLTADPFTNATAGDFSLTTASGGGGACRAAGLIGIFPGGASTGYVDIGAVQHQDSGGSVTNIINRITNIYIPGEGQ
jgi:hypothetical protein